MKKLAIFIAKGIHSNSIFDFTGKSNRDNCLLPYYLLRESFLQNQFEINTIDVAKTVSPCFELHMNVNDVLSTFTPSYLLMLETPQIYPANSISSKWQNYRKIFTWRDDLVDSEYFIKINFPNPITIPNVDGWADRPHFSCIIAGNKYLAIQDDRDLYKERLNVIRWFESHAPSEFNLYGNGWDIPTFKYRLIGKAFQRLHKIIKPFFNLSPFPSYRGKVEHKRDVLLKTRFSFCYENVRDLPGYITEKIFDSFFSGCVPVYWGASNISEYIPEDCFIDRRKFKDTESVYRFLKGITEKEFLNYQQRIVNFLASEAAVPFSAEAFADTIVKTIVKDLEHKP